MSCQHQFQPTLGSVDTENGTEDRVFIKCRFCGVIVGSNVLLIDLIEDVFSKRGT